MKPQFIILLAFTAFTGCRPTIEVEYTNYNTKVSYELNAIQIFENNNVLVVGGNVWNNSYALRSKDEGNHWTQIDLFGRGLYALTNGGSGQMYACGIDKKIYRIDTASYSTADFHDYLALKSIGVFDSNHIMLAGGESLGLGYLYKANLSNPSIELSLELKRELNVIHCLDSLQWIAAGFGIVLRTNNGGLKWDTIPVYGEHFLDVSFIDQHTGYLCGIGGSIYKTVDGGLNWVTLRDASKFFVSDQAFRCICFRDENHGLVAGESGIVWKTNDGGKHWLIVENLPEVNYLDIQWKNGRYWMCGSHGTVLSLL